MKFFLCFFVTLSALAVDDLHYFELDVEHRDSKMGVTIDAKPLFAYSYLRDQRYLLNESDYDHNYDGPFRQIVFLMRTLERNRGVLMAKGTQEPMPILRIKFQLSFRAESGFVLQENKYQTIVSLGSQPNECIVSCPEWGTKKAFNIRELTNPKVYESFIEYLAIPHEKKVFPRPMGDGFVVDILYRWPDVLVDESDARIFDLFPSLLLWDKGIANRIRRHVSTAYTYKNDGAWQTMSSTHARVFSDSINAFTNVLDKEKVGLRDYIISLEEYLDKVPSDKRALKRLMDAYLEEEMDIEAYGLISRYQPFFATIRDGLDNQKDLAANAERKRNFLLGTLSRFQRDEQAKVKIQSPANNDLVTGTTRLEFNVVANDADLLLVEAYLGDERIARLDSPPFSVPFSVDGLSNRKAQLVVKAYFQNETYQMDEIKINVLDVDEEERVNLVPLRASILSAKNRGNEVKQAAFSITENGEERTIEHFRQSHAPLRIAFVVDTSGSMTGEKIFATQFALKSFIEKLQPDDRAAVFTFDDRVLKISDFTNKFTDLSSQLMSLTPKGGTSLYDAMLIAHDALLGENGTKVLIVMSDGDDSVSATTDLHVMNTLRFSPVMVYSVILTGGPNFNESRKAREFLKQVAKMTGSIHTKVRNPENLPEIFERIYNDLRSFYYLDYYSQLANPEERKLEVRYKGAGRLRYRVLR